MLMGKKEACIQMQKSSSLLLPPTSILGDRKTIFFFFFFCSCRLLVHPRPTLSQSQSPKIRRFYVVKKRRVTDFEALNLRKDQSGSLTLSPINNNCKQTNMGMNERKKSFFITVSFSQRVCIFGREKE